MIHYSIWNLVTLRWSGLMVLRSEAQPCPASGQLLACDWLVVWPRNYGMSRPLIGYLSNLNQDCVHVLASNWFQVWVMASYIGQLSSLSGLITESWPLIGQSWLPVSPRPWRKIMEAVCLILGFRITGFNDILLLLLLLCHYYHCF